ncbi:hypothetical protein [Erythrobacter sp. 3-20A1M]|uniref:hypothetical protein n=1 Tax=Erythrobacter sp. 3-20A1M TaxID=2653850 RepID=UPI001BFC7498
MTRSRIERGTEGHYVKTRAARADIAASDFDDSQRRGINYMIDLSQGAAGKITNNWFGWDRNLAGSRTRSYIGRVKGGRLWQADGPATERYRIRSTIR